MDKLFNSIFGGDAQTTISVWNFLLCIGVSLVLGFAYYIAYSLKNKTSSSYKTSLVFLPPVVCVVIMMVSGNIGIGVAIAGAFSLIRFRSAQGSAKEICVIFMAMCSGLIAGVGYLAFAVLFTILMCALVICSNLIYNAKEKNSRHKTLKITIPEDLDYTDIFADIFARYTDENRLMQVKTSNMGSLYKLTYDITLKKDVTEKQFMDELRIRNGNLEIMILREEQNNVL